MEDGVATAKIKKKCKNCLVIAIKQNQSDEFTNKSLANY